jgi:hypothetical protein
LLTKCKHVTHSVLASKIYNIVNSVNISFTINATVNIIIKQISLSSIPLVVYTDLYLLYECIVKLETTHEKRLIIDIIVLRKMYERRKLVDIRWISSNLNPADTITKASPNRTMQQLIDNNQLTVSVEEWIQR